MILYDIISQVKWILDSSYDEDQFTVLFRAFYSILYKQLEKVRELRYHFHVERRNDFNGFGRTVDFQDEPT